MELLKLIPDNMLVEKKYKKGTVIADQGSICDNLSFVIKGEVIISTYTIDDKEYVISQLSVDDSFGEMIIFNPDNHYLGNIISQKDTIIKSISKHNLTMLLSTNKDFLLAFLSHISSRAINIQNRSKVLLQNSIRDKILFYLNENYQKNNDKTIYIDSKENLAKYLNIPRPSLSRELINMRNEDIISFDRHKIIYKRPQ